MNMKILIGLEHWEMNKKIKSLYWKLPFLSNEWKENFFYELKGIIKGEKGDKIRSSNELMILRSYVRQVLSIPTDCSKEFFKTITRNGYQGAPSDPKLIAYYLPQMHPTEDNDRWWGKGITEWNNVSKAVPQYLGHYQPRLPGELGYYDLRLKENLIRQIELAKIYGIYAFCWYYYWFDGKRLLNRPLDMYLENQDIEFPFCLCWANEDWTRSFSGSSKEVLIKQSRNEESYKAFIHGAIPYLKDDRYVKINEKKLLIVYKPMDMPNSKVTTDYWREYCSLKGVGDLYIVGCWTSDLDGYQVCDGFDAMAEFQPGSIINYCSKINKDITFVNDTYFGAIYDYEDIINSKIYKRNFSKEHLYNAVMPMWDNTSRRNNKGSIIFDGANPDIYKCWLKEVIRHNQIRTDLDDNLIFINAWNEWGEGAYLEPDRRYGYAYLQATLDAILETRQSKKGE